MNYHIKLYNFKNTSLINIGVAALRKEREIAVRTSKKPIKNTNIII